MPDDRRPAGAGDRPGSLYIGAAWLTYFLIGLGLFSFLGWLGCDHLVTRVAAVLALGTIVHAFEVPGEILAGCHEPGHYAAGMVTSLTVAGALPSDHDEHH